MKTVFVPTVQKRGAAVIAARKLSSAMSAAKAASDHMKSWSGDSEYWQIFILKLAKHSGDTEM